MEWCRCVDAGENLFKHTLNIVAQALCLCVFLGTSVMKRRSSMTIFGLSIFQRNWELETQRQLPLKDIISNLVSTICRPFSSVTVY